MATVQYKYAAVRLRLNWNRKYNTIPLIAGRAHRRIVAPGVPDVCVCVCKAGVSAYQNHRRQPHIVACHLKLPSRSASRTCHDQWELPMARNAQASGHLATRGRVCGVRCAVKVFPVLERRWTQVPTDLPKQPYSSKTATSHRRTPSHPPHYPYGHDDRCAVVAQHAGPSGFACGLPCLRGGGSPN